MSFVIIVHSVFNHKYVHYTLQEDDGDENSLVAEEVEEEEVEEEEEEDEAEETDDGEDDKTDVDVYAELEMLRKMKDVVSTTTTQQVCDGFVSTNTYSRERCIQMLAYTQCGSGCSRLTHSCMCYFSRQLARNSRRKSYHRKPLPLSKRA